MISNIPPFVNIIFIVTTLITFYLFNRASKNNKTAIIIIISWLVLQGIISFTGFYLQFEVIPPRFLLLVSPPIMFVILMFISPQGKTFIDSLNQEFLTWIHAVRVPVELVLFWLFIYGKIPELMTFEGRNFDIFSGLTAPIIAVLGFRHNRISKKWLLAWNFICLALLFNIVGNAILSAPTPIQRFAFEQPNVGVMYFPFSWLPCFIVPLVLFAHLSQIRFLLKK